MPNTNMDKRYVFKGVPLRPSLLIERGIDVREHILPFLYSEGGIKDFQGIPLRVEGDIWTPEIINCNVTSREGAIYAGNVEDSNLTASQGMVLGSVGYTSKKTPYLTITTTKDISVIEKSIDVKRKQRERDVLEKRLALINYIRTLSNGNWDKKLEPILETNDNVLDKALELMHANSEKLGDSPTIKNAYQNFLNAEAVFKEALLPTTPIDISKYNFGVEVHGRLQEGIEVVIGQGADALSYSLAKSATAQPGEVIMFRRLNEISMIPKPVDPEKTYTLLEFRIRAMETHPRLQA